MYIYNILSICTLAELAWLHVNDRNIVEILVSNGSDLPIYEQIASQIKNAILSGDLEAEQKLPSIRSLANGLGVSVITTKRAYADLEAAGFIYSVQGKGSFVQGGSAQFLREERLRRIEDLLFRSLEEAKGAGISLEELHQMLELLAEGE